MLQAYLAATGWSQAQFAREVGLKQAILSLYLSGGRAISTRSALLISRATATAKAEGRTKVAPVTLAELVPEFATAKAS